MPGLVPTPVAAALGLVPAVLDGVRRLPGRAAQLPILVVSSTLAGLDHARREYDGLAERGERLIASLRGTSFDELEDRLEDRLQGTPLARPYDAVEDALEDAGEAVARAASRTAGAARAKAGGTGSVSDLTSRVASRAGSAAEEAGETARTATKATKKAARKAAEKPAGKGGQAADAVEQRPADEQPKGEATPSAPAADDVKVDTAATAEVVETVEQVVEKVDAPEVTQHDDLPLPDYDHMTLGSLRGRLRSLSTEELVQVRDYEKAHANRLPIVTMLDNRIAKLATDPGATPSGGDPAAVAAPEKAQARPKGGSKADPASGGRAATPPTNPAQPRTGGLGMDHSS